MDQSDILNLEKEICGELHLDELFLTLYSTDASAYKEKPIGVVLPKNKEDIRKIVEFAHTHQINLIPRAAGTSLAGQVVGYGLVVDISKYLRKIVEFNKEEKWVKVQPGVNLEELNNF